MRQLLCDKQPGLIPALAVIQRVKSASVTVDNQLVSSIGRGLLVLAGVGKGDDEKEADSLISRIMRCRLWPDDNGKQVGDRSCYSVAGATGTDEAAKQWKKNVQDIEGEILCGMARHQCQLDEV